MTTVVSVAQGGTGANSAASARTNLGAAPLAAYDAANNAYSAANTGNLLAGGVITGTLNVTQDIIVGGNVYLEGNTTFINVATYSIEDSLMYLASNNSLTDSVDIGFMGGKNTSGTFSHTGLARDATDGKYKLFDGLPDNDHVGNVVNFANSYLATLVANVEANTLTVVNGVSGNVNFDSGTLFVDSVNNRVGVGTTTPESNFDVSATGQVTSTIRSMSTGGARDAILRLNILSTGGDDPAGNIKFTVGNSYTDVASIQAVYNPNRLLFYTGTTERLRIDSFGRIGVGTTDPTAELHIYKSTGPTINLQAGSSGTKGLKIIKGDSGTAYINNIDAQDLVLATNNTNRVIIAGEGFVGINTSTISERLTVTGNIKLTTGSIVYVENPAGGRTGALFTDSTGTELRSHNGAGEPLTLNAPDSTAYMAFRTAGGERARILSSGNVGIGTTNPAAKFQVSDSSTPHIRSHFSGAAAAGNKGALIFSHNRNSDGTQETLGYIQSVAEDNQSAGGIRFVARNNTDVETFRITSAGNLGIGTTSPGSKLDVVTSTEADSIRINNTSPGVNSGNKFGFVVRENGTDKIFLRYRRDGSGIAELFNTSDAPFVLGANNTEHIRITAAGNLGVGATNPQGKLTISNAGAEGIEFFTTGGVGSGPYFNAYNRSTGRYVPFTYYANTHTFYTNTGSTRVLDLTTAGNIGIGTASSDYAKVHIRESGITAAAISTGWPHYNADTAAQSKYVLHLDAGSNGSVATAGQGPSAVLLVGNYYDSRGIITMLGAGGGSPSDGGTGYGKDLMVKAGNSDNGNGYVGGRLFLAGGSGYSGGAFGSNYGPVVMQPQGGNVGIGTTNPSQKLHVIGNILANGCPVQVQYTSSGTRTTVDSTSFVEPSSSYRVAITPKSTSSMIRLRFFIPANAYGASNTIYTVRLFRIIGGSTSYSLTSAGGSNGSRNVIAGSTFRPPGYDNNDPMPMIIDAVDFPSTTSTCTYGFEFKRETGGAGTVYFGYTQDNNSNWGFDADIVIIAEEIGQ